MGDRAPHATSVNGGALDVEAQPVRAEGRPDRRPARWSSGSACTARQRPVGMSRDVEVARHVLVEAGDLGGDDAEDHALEMGRAAKVIAGRRSSTTWSSRRHASNRKAPVPTGRLAKAVPRRGPPRAARRTRRRRRSGAGRARTACRAGISTVSSSTTRTPGISGAAPLMKSRAPVIFSNTQGRLPRGRALERVLHVGGPISRPLWNFTPGRSANV